MSGSIAQFEFETAGFLDSARDRAERVNEHIGSMSLARWLSAALRARGYETSEPWGEDHGCDFSLTQGGKTYICACYSDDDEDAAPAAPRRAGVTVDQTRGLMDRLLGRNRASNNDPVAEAVAEILGQHADVSQLRRVS